MDPMLVQVILMSGRILAPVLFLVLIMCLGEFFRRRAEKSKKKDELY